MANRKLYLDIDGVVADLWSAAQKEFGKPLVPRYSLEETFPHASDEHIAYWLDSPKTYQRLDPVPGAVEGIQALKHAGWQVKFITARPAFVQVATEVWLKKHGLIANINQVTYVIKDIYIPKEGDQFDAAVEDNLDHARLLGEYCGCVFLFNWPYNFGPAGKAMRIGDSDAQNWWDELLAELLGGVV